LQAHGFAVGIASITWRSAAEHFAGEWGIEHCLARTLQASGGYYEMLGAVGTSIFVGSESPPVQQDRLHWPAANIEHLAHDVIGAIADLP
jgi:hypothetical protein